MAEVRLNGKPLQAAIIPVNPALDRDAAKAYLEFRKDGLDSLGVEVKGQHLVLVGKGFPGKVESKDRLELSSQAAQVLYSEQEINDFSEGFLEAARSNGGAAGLLVGLALGAAAAYTASLLGFLTLPVFLSMLIFGFGGGLLGVGLVGTMAGFGADKRPTSYTEVERLQASPSTLNSPPGTWEE